MRQNIIKNDYVGFTLNGLHSSQFGIKSVTSGNRYTRNLLPESSDETLNMGARDGTLFFGSTLKSTSFSLNIAFDDITEQERREISVWLHNRGGLSTLIYDELPYIEYIVKCARVPSLKFIVFEDKLDTRIYKGEGQIDFVAYEPYGYIARDSNGDYMKWLSDYALEENLSEWAVGSKLLPSNQKNGVPYYDLYNDGVIPLYNAGDVEVDFRLKFDINEADEVKIEHSNEQSFTLNLSASSTVEIDTYKRLIKVNNIIDNDVLIAGNIFKIPVEDLSSQFLTFTTDKILSNVSIIYPYKFI